MGLFQPGLLIWLILAPIVVLLYLMGRRRAVNVSSHLLWQRAIARQSPWRRWQRGLSAALMALSLVALAVALSEPYWRSDHAAARTMVLVLGPVMQAKPSDGTPQQPQPAQVAALKLVDGMKVYERMAIVSAAGPAHVVCPLTDDRVKLRLAIEESSDATAAETISEGKSLAEWLVADAQNPEVTVIDSAGTVSGGPAGSMATKHSDPPGAWLLLAVIALCSGEWLLFTRRVTV